MSLANEETAVVNEERWRAWVQKGKLAQQTITRRMNLLVGVLALVVLGTVAYLVAAR